MVWLYSVWDDKDALRRFAYQEGGYHDLARKRLSDKTKYPHFDFRMWRGTGEVVLEPVDWQEVADVMCKKNKFKKKL